MRGQSYKRRILFFLVDSLGYALVPFIERIEGGALCSLFFCFRSVEIGRQEGFIVGRNAGDGCFVRFMFLGRRVRSDLRQRI